MMRYKVDIRVEGKVWHQVAAELEAALNDVPEMRDQNMDRKETGDPDKRRSVEITVRRRFFQR